VLQIRKPGCSNCLYDQLVQRLRTLPGVESASAIDIMPLSGGGSTQPIALKAGLLVPMAEQPEVQSVSLNLISCGPCAFHSCRPHAQQCRHRRQAASDSNQRCMAKRIGLVENPMATADAHVFPGKTREVSG